MVVEQEQLAAAHGRTSARNTEPVASRVRLGGFVIHGDAVEGLEECLASMAGVCDELVCVDSGRSRAGEAIAARHGARTVARRWEGYGAERATAARALPGCDYVFFLDSDEALTPGGVAALRRWSESKPTAPYYN